MTFSKNWPSRTALALLTLIFVTGCARFGDTIPVPPDPRVLQPDSRDIVSCPDPGIGREVEYGISEAVRDLAATREALAICRRRHANLVAFIADVRGEDDVQR